MTEYFDTLETRNPQERENEIFERLPEFLADISSRIPGWKTRFANIDVSSINNRAAFEQLPVMRKDELMAAQSANPPFGGFVDETMLNGNRVYMSPGPVWEPQAPGPDPWQAARSLFAGGVRPGDIVHCAMGFSMTPGGAILDEGIRALGGVSYPAGVGNTEMQVSAIAALKPRAYAGTPDYLGTILEKADEMGVDVSSIKLAHVSGGALFPSMRQAYQERGIQVSQAYGTADIGMIAFETFDGNALCEGMVCNENLIVEIVRPGTDTPVADGEVGEIVVTSFNTAYPLIRFGTGDMSAVISEPSPCGRTNTRIKGWMGRADQRTKVKGMFIDPKQVGELLAKFDGLESARIVVSRDGNADQMCLEAVGSDLDLAALEAEFQKVTKLKGSVKSVDNLPNDGMVIKDERDYSE